MKLSQLLAALPHSHVLLLTPEPYPASEIKQRLDTDITKITSDSRQVEPGDLFVAYAGVSVNSHDFIPQAIARGAVAVVGEVLPPELVHKAGHSAVTPLFIRVPDGREALAYLAAAWYQFPARRLIMVGITGTDGKTTTTNFLYHIIQASQRRVSMINTVNAVIGDQRLETGLHTTTPDSPDVQRYLAQMVAADTELCLLEVTSHGLAHHRVTACDFDVAIVTNITHEHLDLHGSLAHYRAAKAKLFESLALSAAKGGPKGAVLNCDDESFAYLKAKLAAKNIPWWGYSLHEHPEAHLTAADIAYGPAQTRFTIHAHNDAFVVQTALVGDYNVSNCLAAATAALELLGIAPPAVQQGIAALPGIPGRLERIDAGQPFIATVDFAHTPNALQRVLTVARTLTPGRVIAVFGCAGLRDSEKRTTMGRIAAALADMTLLTAEDPRTESLDDIMAVTAQAMLAAGAVEGQTFERVPDRGRAIYRAVQLARSDDIVLVLGKGHEQSMCFGRIEYPWDDRQALRSALKGSPLLTLPTAD